MRLDEWSRLKHARRRHGEERIARVTEGSALRVQTLYRDTDPDLSRYATSSHQSYAALIHVMLIVITQIVPFDVFHHVFEGESGMRAQYTIPFGPEIRVVVLFMRWNSRWGCAVER